MLAEHHTLLEHFASRALALARFLERRYWTRRWVLQEIRHSKAVSIYWNRFKISLRQLEFLHWRLRPICMMCRGAALFMQKTDPVSLSLIPCNAMLSLVKHLEHVHELFSNPSDRGAEEDLGRLLTLFSNMKCSDPRDQLFSMLSLVSINWIRPDYTEPTIQIYIAFAKGLIERGKADLVLRNVNRFLPTDEISANLPSWVPDLREKFYRTLNPEGTSTISIGLNRDLETSLLFLGTVKTQDDAASSPELISNAQRKPWLGIFARKTIEGCSYQMRFEDEWAATNSRLISMLRNGDILCTSHSDLADPWVNWMIRGVLMFVRRTNANGFTYRIICVLGGDDFRSGFIGEFRRISPSKMTMQLV